MQAAIARLGARLCSGLLDAAADAAVALQDAPEQVRREARRFWDEVEQEAERLERGSSDSDLSTPDWSHQGPPAPADLQAHIDALRAQVAAFGRRLDQPS